MNTLIVPCAGRSSRYPGMRPKWLLTAPDGRLMLSLALAGLRLERFERIIITLVRRHDELHEARLILSQALPPALPLEICLLEDFTSCVAETVLLTLQRMQVEGPFAVKDCDNQVSVELPQRLGNHLVGYDLQRHPDTPAIPSKSFILADEHGRVQDIVEKRVVSSMICVGLYCFAAAAPFTAACTRLLQDAGPGGGELYLSHVISHLIRHEQAPFTLLEAGAFEDYGTLAEWRQLQERSAAYFVDLDGVVLENRGAFGSRSWAEPAVVLEDNVRRLRELQARGAQLIVTTARPEEQRGRILQLLGAQGLQVHALIMGLHHAPRVLINDFAPTNPYPSARAVSLPRDGTLRDYLP